MRFSLKQIITRLIVIFCISVPLIVWFSAVNRNNQRKEQLAQRGEQAWELWEKWVKEANKQTGDVCNPLSYIPVQPPEPLGGSPRISFLGKEISLYPGSLDDIRLKAVGDKIELWYADKKVGEKFNFDSPTCKNRRALFQGNEF